MKRSKNDSGNVSRNELMQQRAHCSRLRYDVSARLDINIIATLPLSHSEEFQRQSDRRNKRSDARDRMIDSVLKALALTALASIAISAVRWLVRRPTALLVVLMILGASTLLMHQ
jgi:Flp pilus assembly protein TadB